jgi:PAS domain S-box-containing protein
MDGKIVYTSPKIAAYGYSSKELVGRSIFELIHPRDRKFAVKALANARKTGRTLPMISYRLRKKNGGYFFMEQKSGLIKSGGRPVLITGVVRDVSGKLCAEAALKESEATLRNIFETAKDAIFIKDLAGRYIKLNNACAGVFLLKPGAALGRTDAGLLPPEAAQAAAKDDLKVVRTGKTITRTYDMALPSGRRYFNTVKTPLRNVAGEIIGVLGVTRDITNVKKTESELAAARTSGAISKVAGPLAHGVNNALAVIRGYATLIDEAVENSDLIKAEIGQIIKAVKRAAKLTLRLQSFAGKPKSGNRNGGNNDAGRRHARRPGGRHSRLASSPAQA